MLSYGVMMKLHGSEFHVPILSTLMCNKNTDGDRTNPCGTPALIWWGEKATYLIFHQSSLDYQLDDLVYTVVPQNLIKM